jgi:Zn-dependent protease with chaperone function
MSRQALILMVGLASFAALNAMVSLLVWVAWRVWRPIGLAGAVPAIRARRLVWLRALPGALAMTFTVAVVLPAFVSYEPITEGEAAGPMVWLLAAMAAAQVLASVWVAATASLRTRAVTRAWLQSSGPLDVDPPAGVPAFAVESASPIVALVGVLSPKLIAARSVLDRCTPEELTRIVAHERGHVQAHDNLKRWLFACAPDLLRWTPLHAEIAAHWHDAAEDAADDVATGGDAQARVDLAALLVKMARLTPEPSWPAAAVSPFVEQDGLERRVRRLLETDDAAPRANAAIPVLVIATGALAVMTVASPAALKGLYDIIEAVIAFGR